MNEKKKQKQESSNDWLLRILDDMKKAIDKEHFNYAIGQIDLLMTVLKQSPSTQSQMPLTLSNSVNEFARAKQAANTLHEYCIEHRQLLFKDPTCECIFSDGDGCKFCKRPIDYSSEVIE